MKSIKIVSISFLFVWSIFFLQSCVDPVRGTLSKNDSLVHIPSSISMLISVDLPSMMKKMDFEAVQKMDFYQDVMNEAKKESKILAQILRDPASSGIDLSKRIYSAYDIDAKNVNNIFTYNTVSLKDANAFEQLLKEATKLDFSTQSSFQYVEIASNTLVAWDDEIAMVATKMNQRSDLLAAVENVFNTDSDNSIIGNKDLQKSLSSKHDMYSWMSSDAISNNPEAQLAAGFANIKVGALKGNFIHGYADFKDGEITSKADYFLNADLTKDVALLIKDNVKTDFSKHIPSDNLNFAGTVALDLKGLNQVLSERPQAKSFVNFSLQEYGVSLDDFVKNIGGDLLVAGYIKGKKGKENAMIMGLSIANREGFQKLLDTAEKFDMLLKIGDNEYKLGEFFQRKFSYALSNSSLFVKDDVLLVATNQASYNAIKNNTFTPSKTTKKLSKLSKSHVLSMLVDIESIEKTIGELENVNGNELELKSTRKNTNAALSFENKKENGLKQLFTMMNAFYSEEKK